MKTEEERPEGEEPHEAETAKKNEQIPAPDFAAMDDAKLIETFNEMVETAGALGLKAKTLDAFSSHGVGVQLCTALHARIVKKRGEIADPKPKVKKPAAPKKTEPAEAAAPEKTATAPAAAEAGQSAPAKEGQMATTKKTKKPKFTGKRKTPKASKKVTGAKKAKGGGGGKRVSFPGDAKITMILKENPRREGTDRHARFELLKKHDGKTVDTFMKNGGKNAILLSATRRKWAKVEGGTVAEKK